MKSEKKRPLRKMNKSIAEPIDIKINNEKVSRITKDKSTKNKINQDKYIR